MPSGEPILNPMYRVRVVHLLLAAVLALGSAADVYASKGFRLQQHSDFYGPSVASVSPTSMRLASTKFGLTLFMATPDFSLSAINDKNHQFTKMSYDQWRAVMTGPKYPTPYIKVGSTVVAGMEADEYLVLSMKRGLPKKNYESLIKNGKLYNSRYWVTRKIDAPGKLFELFSDALGVPNDLGFPLRMIQYGTDGKALITFDTKKLEHVEVEDTLEIPASYAKAQDEMALLVSGMDTGNLDISLEDEVPKSKQNTQKASLGWIPGMKGSEVAPSPKSTKQITSAGGWYPGR